MMCTVLIMYSVYCTLCTLYSTVQCTVYIHCILYTVVYSGCYSVQRIPNLLDAPAGFTVKAELYLWI